VHDLFETPRVGDSLVSGTSVDQSLPQGKASGKKQKHNLGLW